MNWKKNYWIHLPDNVISSLPSLAFVNAKEFEVKCKDNKSIACMLNITNGKKVPEVDLAVTDPVSIFGKYSVLAEVFFEGAANTFPAHGNQNLLFFHCKKKYGTLRLYVDHHGLNLIIRKN